MKLIPASPGKVADQIGLELLAIAQHQQVITITHLPVIAARINDYLVEKAMDDHSTWTTIEEVVGKARASAVASLIGDHRDAKVFREVAESLLSEGSKQ